MKVLVRPTPVRENRLARRRSQSGGAWPGGDLDRVAHWLQEAAPVAGYVRVRDRADHLPRRPAGVRRGRLEQDSTIEQIAASCRQMIDVYSTAEEANR